MTRCLKSHYFKQRYIQKLLRVYPKILVSVLCESPIKYEAPQIKSYYMIYDFLAFFCCYNFL